MARLILILGGARSGKSRFGQQLAGRIGGSNVLFVATADAGDDEMARRIRIHQESRPKDWVTCEASRRLGAVLREASFPQEVVLVDCLTLLVSNLLLATCDSRDVNAAEITVNSEIDALLASVAARRGTAIIVSSEVGEGIVPDNILARQFRDLLGWANQAVARQADEVFWMVAGLPVEVRALTRNWEQAASDSPVQPEAGPEPTRTSNDRKAKS